MPKVFPRIMATLLGEFYWTKVEDTPFQPRLPAVMAGQEVFLRRAGGRVISDRTISRSGLRNVLYLHGFASSPRGRKAEALRSILEKEGFRVLAPDLNVPSFERLDFRAMSRLATWEMKKHFPAVVVGSSLGALVALAAVRSAPTAPLILIAPALGFGRRWVEKLPPGENLAFFHHGEGRDLTIHRRFFEEMAGADWDREPPETPVVVIMGHADESVPFGSVRQVWERWAASGRLREGSRFVEIPGGDHGLVDQVALIAGEILAAAKQGLGPRVN